MAVASVVHLRSAVGLAAWEIFAGEDPVEQRLPLEDRGLLNKLKLRCLFQSQNLRHHLRLYLNQLRGYC